MTQVNIEKLQRVASSHAGPGHDFFRRYQVSRDREIDRLERIEKDEAMSKADQVRKDQVKSAQARLEAKTAKNREKRRKRGTSKRGIGRQLAVGEKLATDQADEEVKR